MEKNIFYNSNKLFSYNAIFSFVMGERGCGKTYAGKERMIKDFKRKGYQGIYVRRTKTELDKVKDKVFNDIAKNYPEYEFKLKGDIMYLNDEVFCYFIALSQAHQYRSASFPLVNLIFFDEYISPKAGSSQFLAHEMTVLLDLISTVFRTRRPRVYICSNAVTFVNPFFEFFEIQPKPDDRFIKKKDGLVVVEMTDNKDYLEVVKKTDWAKLLEGTTYYDYAIGNEALEDTSDFIMKNKPSTFNFFRGAFRVGNKIIGLWSEPTGDSGIWCGESYNPNSKWLYTVYNNQNFEGWKNIKVDRGNYNIKYIKYVFLDGRIYFENQKCKKLFTEEISKFL